MGWHREHVRFGSHGRRLTTLPPMQTEKTHPYFPKQNTLVCTHGHTVPNQPPPKKNYVPVTCGGSSLYLEINIGLILCPQDLEMETRYVNSQVTKRSINTRPRARPMEERAQGRGNGCPRNTKRASAQRNTLRAQIPWSCLAVLITLGTSELGQFSFLPLGSLTHPALT